MRLDSDRKQIGVENTIKSVNQFLLPFLIVFLTSFAMQTYAGEKSTAVVHDEAYKLGVGEVISISTFGEPDLKVSNFRIGRRGVVSFPLIGEVEILNKKTVEIEKDIEKKLRNGYLKKPKVTVKIESYRDFFVNGQVNNPGAYSYAPGLTVRKAIAISGGLTDRASTKKIRLKKEFDLAELTVTNVDMVMGPGDVLTVGESLF